MEGSFVFFLTWPVLLFFLFFFFFRGAPQLVLCVDAAARVSGSADATEELESQPMPRVDESAGMGSPAHDLGFARAPIMHQPAARLGYTTNSADDS